MSLSHPRDRYKEPSTKETLVLASFLVLLQVARTAAQKLFRAEIIGMIILGSIYGAPLTGWLPKEWQTTFTACGYLGLILLVLEGALSTDL
ncbi:4884_t:CDS:1, partial [Acaulospora colombiana]